MILDWMKEQVRRDMSYLTSFCRKYDVQIEHVLVTHERAPEIPREVLYVFDDSLGGYTIDGVINSLEENEVEEIRKKSEQGEISWH